jgi:hypothetical protein
LRATIAAAAAVDAFRIWPGTEDAANAVNVAFLGPFVVTLGVNDDFVWSEDGGATFITSTLTAGSYDATTLAAELDTQLTADSAGSAFTVVWDGINRNFVITSDGVGGGGTLDFYWASNANSTAAGLLGFTADDTGALTYTSDVAVPAGLNCFYRAWEGKTYGVTVVGRNSVDRNLLRFRVIGYDENYADVAYLDQDGRWSATAADGVVTFQMSPMWKSFGRTFKAPSTVRYLGWQLSNGTAGAQALDLGRVWWQHPMYQMSGEETRV